MEEEPDLGPCCVCGKEDKTVRNIAMLDRKGEPGKGWGCVVCHLPNDGALAVLCDACREAGDSAVLKFVIKGYPSDKQRMPHSELSEEKHDDDLRYHPEAWSTEPGGTLSPLAEAAAQKAREWDEDEDAETPLLLFYTHPDGEVGLYNAGPFAEGLKYMQEAGWHWREGSLMPPPGVVC